MQKIINAHCHIYPEKIASKAVIGIRDFYDLDMSLDGTVDGLIKDGERIGVTHYLIHSVATTPKQVKSINEFISQSVKSNPDLFTGFGTLHPKSTNIQGDLEYLLELGLKGVKLHPDFQRFALNDEKSFEIGRLVSRADVPMLIHTGDFRYNYSNPEQLKPFLDEFPNLTVIGAHFAGWSIWEDACKQLHDYENLYVDLSSSLYALSPETVLNLIHDYGSDKVLWGTDYPMWDSVNEMEYFEKIDLNKNEKSQILYKNASKLLNLD